MKPFSLFLSLLLLVPAHASDLDSAISQIRAVDREGRGNDAATAAWKTLAQSDPAALPQVLAAMNGANPLAENWLRAAVTAIADRALAAKAMPVAAIQDFLKDTQNSPHARVVAFDLLQQAAPQETQKITTALLNDPSPDLRRHPISKLLEQGDELLAKDDKPAALLAYQKAMTSARDEDQIKALAKKLKALNQPVDLPSHFGFLMNWHLIAPLWDPLESTCRHASLSIL